MLLILLGLVTLLIFALDLFMAKSLSDATRYLTATPDNLEARNELRAEGLALLQALHEDGNYNRIIVVGHSLGSVIGFDLLRLAWEDLRWPDESRPQKTQLAEQFNQRVLELPEAGSKDGKLTSTQRDQKLVDWQNYQHELWKECRERGVRWLVTDFITLGSPLAHASFLLDNRKMKLAVRKKEREYPTCPPDPCNGVFYRPGGDTGNSALVAHHGAPFAVTRWSNAYFPVNGWYGDPVGGPVSLEFGAGIRDIPVRLTTLRCFTLQELIFRSHTKYWRGDLDYTEGLSSAQVKQKRQALDEKSGTRVAYRVLKEFLNLQIDDKHFPLPDGSRPGLAAAERKRWVRAIFTKKPWKTPCPEEG